MQDVSQETKTTESTNLTSVLDSFYSDIAALEKTTSNNNFPSKEVTVVKPVVELPISKKKKTKVSYNITFVSDINNVSVCAGKTNARTGDEEERCF